MSSGELFPRLYGRLNHHLGTDSESSRKLTVRSKLQNLHASPLILIDLHQNRKEKISFVAVESLNCRGEASDVIARNGEENWSGKSWRDEWVDSRAQLAGGFPAAGVRVSPRPGRATRCACARSIRCRSWRLIGRPLPDKSRSRSCRSERGRAAIRGLSARLVYSAATTTTIGLLPPTLSPLLPLPHAVVAHHLYRAHVLYVHAYVTYDRLIRSSSRPMEEFPRCLGDL